jgi:hypothetical protein
MALVQAFVGFDMGLGFISVHPPLSAFDKKVLA